MATTPYGVRLAVLDDFPDRGRTVRGAQAAAYRCATRLLQSSGGLADVIAEEEAADWPELNYRSLDVRDYMGRDVDARDLSAIESQIRAVLLDEPVVDEVAVTVTVADRALEIEAQIVGDEGPFAFVLSVSDIDGATLRTF